MKRSDPDDHTNKFIICLKHEQTYNKKYLYLLNIN